MKMKSAASMMPAITVKYSVYGIREFFTLLVAKTMPSASTRMPPAEPMRLMIALALERSGFIVTSGMSATAGDRKVAMAISVTSRSMMKRISDFGAAWVRSRATAALAGTTYFVYAGLVFVLPASSVIWLVIAVNSSLLISSESTNASPSGVRSCASASVS